MTNSRLKILFIILVVVAVYLPSATSVQVNTVDDVHIINAYGNAHYSFRDIVTPGGKFYYRPIIELSFLADSFFWDLNPGLMHLENVAFHLLNTILVFLIACRASDLKGYHPELPLLSALMFSLHPVNTESVSWIAGRTDLLAMTFILIATYYLLRERSKAHLAIVTSAAFLAILTKETALILLPVLLVVSLSFSDATAKDRLNRFPLGLKTRMLSGLLILTVIVSSLVIRQTLSKHNENAFAFMLERNINLFDALNVAAKSLGFYVKKFFVPLPLNFAIDRVSGHYVILGICVVASIVFFCRKRNVLNNFILFGIAFIVPAIVVSLVKMNWTPVAERYLYIPSAFLAIGCSGHILKLVRGIRQQSRITSVICLLTVPVGTVTFQRNMIWRDNLLLYEDTVRKSPEFGDIRNELGVALMRAGRKQEAKKNLEIAQKTATRDVIRNFAGLNLLWLELDGKPVEARRKMLVDAVDKRPTQPDLLYLLRLTDIEMTMKEKDPGKNVALYREIISLNSRLFSVGHDPFYLYHSGQISLALGERSNALDFYRRVVVSAPKEAYYRGPALQLVKKLEQR